MKNSTATAKKVSYQLQGFNRELKSSISFEALNLENDYPVHVEIEKEAFYNFFDGKCPSVTSMDWLSLSNLAFRDILLDVAEIMLRNRSEGVHITEPKITGYKIYTNAPNATHPFFTVNIGEKIADMIEKNGHFGHMEHEAIFSWI